MLIMRIQEHVRSEEIGKRTRVYQKYSGPPLHRGPTNLYCRPNPLGRKIITRESRRRRVHSLIINELLGTRKFTTTPSKFGGIVLSDDAARSLIGQSSVYHWQGNSLLKLHKSNHLIYESILTIVNFAGPPRTFKHLQSEAPPSPTPSSLL